MRVPTEQELEQLLGADNIYCIASGSVEGTDKYYFFAREGHDAAQGRLYLIEASFTTASKRLACVFKAGVGGNIDSFISIVKSRLTAGGFTAR